LEMEDEMDSIQKITKPANNMTRRDFLGSAFMTTEILSASWLTTAKAQTTLKPGQLQRVGGGSLPK